MRRRFPFRHIALRQVPGCAQALHRVDKAGHVMQAGLLRKRGKRLRLCGRLRAAGRPESEKGK
jgi:hypothetical protein